MRSDDAGTRKSAHVTKVSTDKQWLQKEHKHDGQRGEDASRLEFAFSQVAYLMMKKGTTPKCKPWNVGEEFKGVKSQMADIMIDKSKKPNATIKPFDGNKTFLFFDDPNADSFHDLMKKYKNGEINLDMDSLACILATSYTLEEDDLHKGNIGYFIETIDGKETYKFFKIDHDLMFADQVMSRVDQRFANRLYNKNSFAITIKDLDDFPDLTKSGNHYWPTRGRLIATGEKAYKDKEEREAFKSLKNDESFKYAKWKYFLKHVLTPIDTIKGQLSSTIGEGHEDKADLVTTAVHERLAQLKKVLLCSADFRFFLTTAYLSNNDRTAFVKELFGDLKGDDGNPIFSIEEISEELEKLRKAAFELNDSKHPEKDVENVLAKSHPKEAKQDSHAKTNGIQDFNNKLAAISANPKISLKEKKKQAIELLQRSNLNNDALKTVKTEISQKNPKHPYTFINQLRSNLWVVRKFRGLYGATKTQKLFISEIQKKQLLQNTTDHSADKNVNTELSNIEISAVRALHTATQLTALTNITQEKIGKLRSDIQEKITTLTDPNPPKDSLDPEEKERIDECIKKLKEAERLCANAPIISANPVKIDNSTSNSTGYELDVADEDASKNIRPFKK